ncbi:MAG: GPR endopeptidase [Clostridiales bacterium]|nr:GPR endopeptidase [Clostridiales bacterium]
MFARRTDMAAEARDLHAEELSGVESSVRTVCGISAEEVRIASIDAARLLSKPVGRYTTLDISPLIRREEGALHRCARAVAETVKPLLPSGCENTPILVAGLGNRRITSDCIGPQSAEGVIATRHLLRNVPERFEGMRPVAVIEPGVLGSTGIESAETICGIISKVPVCACVLIDSLASHSHGGLCRSVQISDTGVTPGSGVGNHRFEISRKSIGVPCISVGVPTVVDAKTMLAGIAGSLGLDETAAAELVRENFFVTPKEIDSLSRECSKAVSLGLNLAFQPSLGISDIELLLS